MKKFFIVIGVVIVGGIVWFTISRTGQNPGFLPTSTNTTIEQPSSPVQSLSDQQAGNKAPNFHLQDYSGKTISLADVAGKPLIINSWAAWCPFCRKELVDFAAVQKEFGDQVVIIAIDRAETRETAKKYTDELGVTGDIIFLLDPSDNFYQSIGGFSMPETIFVNSNGDIVFHKRGPMDIQEIRARTKQLIEL